MTAAPPLRDRADACPGALQTHAAADGALARVRIPGGALTAAQLRILAGATRDLGDGALELTSRGNLQLRGLGDGTEAELGDRLDAGGLLPSATHERVRNLLASTLSGRAGGQLDARPWVAAFDAGLCADPRLAALPGRFLATFDDGRGDVVGLGGDVGLFALDARTAALTLAGEDSGLRAAPADAIALALTATRAFLDERAAQGDRAWRLAELEDGIASVAGRLTDGVGPDERGAGGSPEEGRQRLRAAGERHVAVVSSGGRRSCGAVPQDDGRTALIAVVPLGRLTAAQADLLADLTPVDLASSHLQVTPWRSVAIPDLTDVAAAVQLLTSAGLVLDPESPWVRVTACAGLPGCAKSRADVRADAARAVARGLLPAHDARQHWAGCERRCGRPAGAVDVIALGDGGYRVGP